MLGGDESRIDWAEIGGQTANVGVLEVGELRTYVLEVGNCWFCVSTLDSNHIIS